MNKILYLFTFIVCMSCKGQTNIIDATNICYQKFSSTNGNTYLKDISNLYQPFIGTWKWTSGNREMTLVLMKQNKFHVTESVFNYYEDRMLGYYIYKENNITLVNTSNENLSSFYGISVNFEIVCGGNIRSYFFKDIPKNKSYEVKLTSLSPTQFKFQGKMGESSIIKTSTPTIVYGGSTFPLEMIFTKQ
ncbi:DUF6705 family protein [Frigoriflavimonas asaccharolytica]|uniref:DUF6705 domain-containing protein n=1 Tax=Frigoriflavimonas asaccharolytica TaxID=2735899 RepID=A0A8J8K973_9FLAO|nr:DUF6705 family protein [Frigoriflavimonas asaccharolytica]NRS93301.1 hypothetical protein [Frigoriflavimonas asaccharolytica]